ncbi:large neutral amino acids transporter small subunit 2 [Anarhichas minor]|uniref:large neutral amino acids transporter small subunit 2 n=1 Tax=Anarhichas minor TaxID=65739 RepID=UPI003F73F555
MPEGPREESSGGSSSSSSSGASHSEGPGLQSGAGRDAGVSSRVALRKEIGLVSACAIIIVFPTWADQQWACGMGNMGYLIGQSTRRIRLLQKYIIAQCGTNLRAGSAGHAQNIHLGRSIVCLFVYLLNFFFFLTLSGNIIGSGIFVSPKGVLENAGSVGLSLIVWVTTGIITAIGALCYAELGVTIPKSGGDYSYVNDIFGGLAGFLRLWIAVLVIAPTNQAVIALTFSNYILQPLYPSCLPPESGMRLLAAVCLLLLTWVNCSSVRWAMYIQDIFTIGKLLALGLIIILGVIQISKGHYYWLEPVHAFETFREYDTGQMALSFLQGSFAYGGWNFLNYVTEELVDPYR